MLGEQNGTWDLEGKFQVTVVECGGKPCSPTVSRELETGPEAAEARFFLQLHSSSHCQDILHAVDMYLWPLSCGTQPQALAIAEQHRQMSSPLPEKPCCPTGDEGPVFLLATQHMSLAAEGALLACVEDGTLRMQHLMCLKRVSYCEPGSPDPMLLESGMAPSLHCGPLTQF